MKVTHVGIPDCYDVLPSHSAVQAAARREVKERQRGSACSTIQVCADTTVICSHTSTRMAGNIHSISTDTHDEILCIVYIAAFMFC